MFPFNNQLVALFFLGTVSSWTWFYKNSLLQLKTAAPGNNTVDKAETEARCCDAGYKTKSVT